MTAAQDRTPSVVLAHNRYREPGGEERSVAEIERLLRSNGHRVEVVQRSSESLAGMKGRLRAGAAMLSGGERPEEVASLARQADVVHVHNLHPLLGSRALGAARAAGAAVVMHLHNYRLFCAIAIGYRDGGNCTRCRGRNTLPGVLLRCRGNVPEAAVYGAGLAAQQRRILRDVDRFLVPSGAAAERLRTFGLPLDRVQVVSNFLPTERFATETRAHRGEYALYAGRLVEEKGVDVAIAAARRSGVPLAIAGAGPDAARLEGLAAGAPVRFLGRLAPGEVEERLRGAALLVMPSRWDEPCPYAAIEAMAAGVPVLCSRVGGLPELAGGGLDPRDADAWAAEMAALWSDADRRRRLGEEALTRARDRFGPERAYSGLMSAYESAIATRTAGRPASTR